MTIVAGFPLQGVVILGSDGEEGSAISKFAVKKIASVQGNDYTCVVGGAGDGTFIDLAIQEIRTKLRSVKNPSCVSVRLAMESVVTEIFEKRIDRLPDPRKQEDAEFELLAGIWTGKDGGPQLVRVGRLFSLVRSDPEVIGIGTYLAKYLLQTLGPNKMGQRNAERICAYVLAQAKKHVAGCGGESYVVLLDHEGEITEIPPNVIREDEDSTALVMDRGVRMLFNWVDLIGWQLDLARVDQVVDEAASMIKRDLRIHLETIQARDEITNRLTKPPAQQSPTGDPKDPLP